MHKIMNIKNSATQVCHGTNLYGVLVGPYFNSKIEIVRTQNGKK